MSAPNTAQLNASYLEEKRAIRVFPVGGNYTAGTTPEIFLLVEVLENAKQVALFLDLEKEAIVAFELLNNGELEKVKFNSDLFSFKWKVNGAGKTTIRLSFVSNASADYEVFVSTPFAYATNNESNCNLNRILNASAEAQLVGEASSQTLPVNSSALNSARATKQCGWNDSGDCGRNDDDLLRAQITPCSSGNCGAIASNRYPQILISAQTTVDVVDVGDAVFYILDSFNWKKDEIPDNTCRYRFADPRDLVQTDFRLCCPFLGKYLRNGGVEGLRYASEKVLALWGSNASAQKWSVDYFYGLIVLYAMLTVFLHRLLNGKFDLTILYSDKYCGFIEQLGSSRLCHFVDDYTTGPLVGFHQYFRCTPEEGSA